MTAICGKRGDTLLYIHWNIVAVFFRQHFGTDVGVQSVEVPFITSFCPDIGV